MSQIAMGGFTCFQKIIFLLVQMWLCGRRWKHQGSFLPVGIVLSVLLIILLIFKNLSLFFPSILALCLSSVIKGNIV